MTKLRIIAMILLTLPLAPFALLMFESGKKSGICK